MNKKRKECMKGYKNSEGYADSTAGRAMANMDSAEDKKKKKINEKCKRLRLMSNEDLYRYIENRVEKARAEGYNKGKRQHVSDVKDKVMSVKGIGPAKAEEIVRALYG